MYLLAWPVFCVLVGIAAHVHFNRSGIGWGLLSMLISPLFGFLALCAMGRKPLLLTKMVAGLPPTRNYVPPIIVEAGGPLDPRVTTIATVSGMAAARGKPAEMWDDLHSERKRFEPRFFALAAVLIAGAVALAPAARAEDGLSFGGATICQDVLSSSGKDAEMWGHWILGYWSGLNSMQAEKSAAWTGDALGAKGIIKAVILECYRDRHQTLQDAANSVYLSQQGISN